MLDYVRLLTLVKLFLEDKGNNRYEVFPDFYKSEKCENSVGSLCSKYGITKSILISIIESDSPNFVIPDSFIFSKGIALELFSFINKSKLSLNDLRHLFCYFSMGNIPSDCNKSYLKKILSSLQDQKRKLKRKLKRNSSK